MPVNHRPAIARRRLIGLLALLAAVGLTVLLWQRPNPFVSHETVRADLRDANGLAPVGADVRVAGTPIGKVTAIERVGSLARLTLTLDSSVGVVHRDATAALRPRLMFEGTAYVELTPGSASAPALGSAVIPPTHTSTYVPFADVLSVLRARTRGDVQTLAATASNLLGTPAPGQLRATIAAAPRLTSDAAVVARAARGPHASELRDAVSSLSRVNAAAASESPALGASLGAAASTTAALDTAGGQPLDRTIAALPGSASALASGAAAASDLVGRLQALMPRLQPGVAQLTPTLSVVRPLLRTAAPVLNGLPPVLSDAQTALAGAQQGGAPALRAITALQPTLDTLQGSLLTALEQPTALGTPAYLSFLGLFAGGGGASRPFGVNGQGHFMRFGLRFLTGVGLPLPPCTLLTKAAPTLAVALESLGGCTP
jgi:phospholipid/cholesterol/gamma-HCH transport system substrate-binding protein